MADNNLDININTKADKTEVVDLSEAITALKEMDTNVEVDVNIQDSEIEEVEHELKDIAPQIDTTVHISDDGELAHWKDEFETINGRRLQVECDINGEELENAQKRIIDIDGSVINVDSNVDIEEIVFAKQSIQEIKDDLVTVNLDVDDGNLTLTQRNIEELNDETVKINTTIDENELETIKNHITDLNNEIVNITPNIDDTDLNNLKGRISELNDEIVNITPTIDSDDLDNLKSKINELNEEIINIVPTVESNDLDNLRDKINSLNEEIVTISPNIDNNGLESIKNEINDLNNEIINISPNINDDDLNSLKSRISELNDNLVNITPTVDITEIDNLKSNITELNNEIITLTSNVDDTELNNLKDKIFELNNEIINLTTTIDDTDFETVQTKINELNEEVIDINVDDSEVNELDSSVGSLDDSLQDASSSASDLSDSVEDVDSSAIDEVSSSAGDADENLSKASDSASNVQVSISNIDPSVLEQIALAAGASADEMDRLKSNTDDASTSMSMVDAMASATLSAGVTAGFMSASNAAGNYSDTMVRLGYAMSNTSMTAEEAEQKYGSLISSMAEETGRGAGAVRAHLVNMGNVGITNEKVLSESFEGISKAAFQMGESVDSMEQKFQTMALTGRAGSRQLKAFGLETKDLAEAMGVSVDEVKDKFEEMDATSRANILSTALNMKYGAEVTENYKNSYEHLMDSLERAKDYFIRVVGEALLPILIPTIESAANIVNILAGAFRGLPEPIKGVMGGAIGLVAGITSVGLGISATTKFISAAIAPFRLLIESERAAAIAQWLLNVAMDANPIVLVTLAIIALIAILAYLYFNNEQVRNAINGLGEAFVNAGQIIYSSVLNFVNWVIVSLQNLYTYIMTLGGFLESNVSITGNKIVDSVLAVVIFISTLPFQLAVIFTNIIAKTLGFGDNFVQKLISSASRSVSGFMSYISSLPGRFYGELQKMLGYARDFLVNLPAILKNAAINVVKGWIFGTGEHSPGFMYDAFEGELSEMVKVPLTYSPRLNSNIRNLGASMVDSFGNPSLSIGFNIDDLKNIDFSSLDFTNLDLLDNLSNNLQNNGNPIVNLTLNVGTVDKKERVDEIIDAVREYFLWNNTTAGRTV